MGAGLIPPLFSNLSANGFDGEEPEILIKENPETLLDTSNKKMETLETIEAMVLASVESPNIETITSKNDKEICHVNEGRSVASYSTIRRGSQDISKSGKSIGSFVKIRKAGGLKTENRNH